MKKSKSKIFNPAEYDYMDEMPLDGWFWEIIRRSDEYKAYYGELEEAFIRESRKSSRKEYGQKLLIDSLFGTKGKTFIEMDVWIREILDHESWKDVNIKLLEKRVQETFLILSDGLAQTALIIPKPHIKYKQFDHHFYPKIRGVYPVKVVPGLTYGLKMQSQYDVQINKDAIFQGITFNDPTSTIYVGISRRAKFKDVMKGLEPHLKLLLVPPKVRIRAFDKWKYYLIVFDLKAEDFSYGGIVNILSEYYQAPDGQDVFDIRTIENYYKSALVLINGGYKKYLYK